MFIGILLTIMFLILYSLAGIGLWSVTMDGNKKKSFPRDAIKIIAFWPVILILCGMLMCFFVYDDGIAAWL